MMQYDATQHFNNKQWRQLIVPHRRLHLFSTKSKANGALVVRSLFIFIITTYLTWTTRASSMWMKIAPLSLVPAPKGKLTPLFYDSFFLEYSTIDCRVTAYF
jgi:hypothetical protein